MTPREVFLSHSSSNRTVADAVSESIQNHGVPVWYSKSNIMSAQQWQDEIGRALKRCEWFIILLSTPAVGSFWVKQELQYALSHSQYHDQIIPVLVEGCDYEQLSWTLGNFQMADLGQDQNDAYRQILRRWGIGLDLDKVILF